MSVCLRSSCRREFYLFLLVVLSNLSTFPLCSQIEMDFNQIKICQGDSFQLSDFLKNHVKVPLDYQLIGWEEGCFDWISPIESCCYHLQYARKDGLGGVLEQLFYVDVIAPPKIVMEKNHIQLCEGEEISIPNIVATSYDHLYWKDLASGKKIAWGNSLGTLTEDSKQFLLMATNEYCSRVHSELLECELIHPDNFRFILGGRNPNEREGCEVEVFYKGDYLKKVDCYSDDDEFEICAISIDSVSENYDKITVEISEYKCRNHFKVSKVISKNREEDEKIKQQIKYSYNCQSSFGKGKLCIGSFVPIHEMILRHIQDRDFLYTMEDCYEDYNYETYSYPFRYALSFCRTLFKQDRDTFLLSVFAGEPGDNLFFSDTIVVEHCHQKEPEIEFICKRENEQILIKLSSIDTVVNASLKIENRWIDVPFVRSEVSSELLSQKAVFPLDIDLFSNTMEADLSVHFTGCMNYHREWYLNFKSCLQNFKKLYYGAYSSSASILLKRDECMTFQCTNIEEENADTLMVDFSCPEDEIYLKFRLDEKRVDCQEFSYLQFDQPLDYSIVYPFDYLVEDRKVFWQDKAIKLATVQLFEIPSDGIISGSFCGIKFVYKIHKRKDFLVDSLQICYGDSLNLGTFVNDSTLQWNVENLKVSPDSDREYYLYGTSLQGCIVDEKLFVKVEPPLWWYKRDSVYCMGERVCKEDILHTNAKQIILNEVALDENSWVVERDTLFLITLISLCDSLNISIKINVKDCSSQFLKTDSIKSKITLVDLIHYVENLEHFELSIYDRRGRLLRSYRNKFDGWNGKYQSNKLPTDSYWFELYNIDNKEFEVGYFLWEN